MSGGMWNYEQVSMETHLKDVSDTIRDDFPLISKKLNIIAQRLYKVITELDKHYSCDSLIHDLDMYDRKALNLLSTVFSKEKEDASD
jgi:hypothetical protein